MNLEHSSEGLVMGSSLYNLLFVGSDYHCCPLTIKKAVIFLSLNLGGFFFLVLIRHKIHHKCDPLWVY